MPDQYANDLVNSDGGSTTVILQRIIREEKVLSLPAAVLLAHDQHEMSKVRAAPAITRSLAAACVCARSANALRLDGCCASTGRKLCARAHVMIALLTRVRRRCLTSSVWVRLLWVRP